MPLFPSSEGGGSGGGTGCALPGLGSQWLPTTNSVICGIVLAPIPPQPKPKPPCTSQFASYQVSFVENNYGASVQLSNMTGGGVGPSSILALSALESGWGRFPSGRGTNYFNWGGPGDIRCPEQRFGCFSNGFLGSGQAALFGGTNFTYNGQQHATTSQILTDQFQNGATPATAFQALADAGYVQPNQRAGYGAVVGRVNADVDRVIDCLHSLGRAL